MTSAQISEIVAFVLDINVAALRFLCVGGKEEKISGAAVENVIFGQLVEVVRERRSAVGL